MPAGPLRLRFDSRDPDLASLRDVARACREGKVVAFPTETVYGIGLPMSIPGAAQKLASLKKRSEDKPFAYHIADWVMLDFLGVQRTPVFRFLTHEFWPGPVTVITHNDRHEKVGLRFPNHRLACALINTVGEPFFATSANVSGQPSPRTADEAMRQLESRVDYLIDAGPCEYGQDSTVVDATGNMPVILRKGAKAASVEAAIEKIRQGKFPRKRVLLVCTGNSCRTPMAAGWLQRELREKKLLAQIEIVSCGIVAPVGRPATAEAVYLMKNHEIDISEHRSRPCTREDVVNADLIIAMGRDHYLFLSGMVPSAKNKIRVLDVADPIGLGMPVYEQVFSDIEKKLKDIWKEIIA